MMKNLDVDDEVEEPDRAPGLVGCQSGINSGQLYKKIEPPDRFNNRIYRAYVLGNFELCKRLVTELLSKSNESICEYALMTRALIAREEGEIRDSMNWLNKIVTNSPNSQRVSYEIGRNHLLLGEHQKAESCFQKSIEGDPKNWRYYYCKAEAIYYKQTSSLDETQDCLLECPKLNKSVEMLLFVAKTCIQKNDLMPAIEAYKIAQELEPENLEVISHLGLLYLKSNNEEKAFSCLGKALTYDPNHLPSVLAAATVLQMNGDYDVALIKYRIAATTCDHSGELWNNIGMCFLGKGKLVAAMSCLKRANYLCPLDWKVLYNLSLVYSAMMQFASAYNFMSAALNLQPRNKTLLMGLAVTLGNLNDFANARKAYKRALQLEGDDFILRLNCAVFEFKHGEVEDSVQMLEGLKSPRNIEAGYLADLNLLAERLKNCLRRHPKNSKFHV